ncbi:serine transporter [Photobacterium sp. SKA34]|uniref:amino acid permease n=1 Tax=Photobacterium sp. SKA34 TaxID=121723 RepID=UPI00006B4090|nr:serine transporter [Photobacterium sp. SKA34]EAR57491.1 serine transporter [Photobacterium sp. SKA34]
MSSSTLTSNLKSNTIGNSFKTDVLWILAIYGCAVGSGSLFWPISLGSAGIWSMVILIALAFPVTYFTYRVLAQYIAEGTVSKTSKSNLIDTTNELLGNKAVKYLTVAYFLIMIPSLAVYAITMSNTFLDFFKTQLEFDPLNRNLTVCGILTVMSLISLGKTETIVKVVGFIVFPFIISLIFFGVMSIPHWNTAFLSSEANTNFIPEIFKSTFNNLPVLIFAFSFTPIVSSLVAHYKQSHGEHAFKKIDNILIISLIIIISTVVFFSLSCIFTLTPSEIKLARVENLTSLSILARKFDAPWLAICSQVIIFFAAMKAFLGTFIATRESLIGMAKNIFKCGDDFANGLAMRLISVSVVFVITLIPTIENLDIINIIKYFMVPVSVFIVFFLPQYSFYKVPKLNHCKGGFINWFVIFTGIFAMFSGFI